MIKFSYFYYFRRLIFLMESRRPFSQFEIIDEVDGHANDTFNDFDRLSLLGVQGSEHVFLNENLFQIEKDTKDVHGKTWGWNWKCVLGNWIDRLEQGYPYIYSLMSRYHIKIFILMSQHL